MRRYCTVMPRGEKKGKSDPAAGNTNRYKVEVLKNKNVYVLNSFFRSR